MKIRFEPGKISFRVKPSECELLLSGEKLSETFKIPQLDTQKPEKSEELINTIHSIMSYELELCERPQSAKLSLNQSENTLKLLADFESFKKIHEAYPKESGLYSEYPAENLKFSLEIDFKGGRKVK